MAVGIFGSDLRKGQQIVGGCMSSISQQIAEAIAFERERCAQVAEHLNGWGNKATQQSGLAEHIAKTIRETS